MTALCQCVLRFFQSTCLKYCACHEKVMPGHTKCCTCHAKSSHSKPEDPMLQNATLLRKSAPGPPNSSDEHVSLYCACHGKCTFADLLQMSHACHRFWTCDKPLTFCSLLTRCTVPRPCHAKRHLNNFQKWSGAGVFCTF